MRAGLAPASGSVVGGFRLDRRLGGGEDTDVWRADGDGIVVALKLLRDTDDPFARARLAREAAALRRIDDDHVITLFAAGEEDGEPYLATPLLDAGTLAMLLDDGRLDVATVAAILAPIASALATAHAAGVVHRDVKPANVLLTTEGPVLVDFGAAALDGVTLDGWIDGAAARVATTAYAAPDEVVTPAFDVWSLGVMLQEAVTGRTDVSQPDAAVAALVRACCAIEPSTRPSARDVAARLRALAGAAAAPSVPAPIVLDDADASGPRDAPAAAGALQPGVRHGRELEVAQLLDMIDAAQAARELRGVLVVAPPGMGKSWLLDHAAAQAVASGSTVLRATCTEAVNDLRVLAPWLRRVGDHDRLVELLGAHHADLVAHVTGVEAGGGVEADPATIADAFAALVGACERPVAVVDDLHHAADDLLDLLGRLAFRAGIQGALWLGARPGYLDADDLDIRTLTLGPLPDDVIVDLAGAEAVELAGGNPLLAHELVLARAQMPAQADTHDAITDQPLPHPASPDVRVLIGQRLARLGGDAAGELELAATCGDVFWPETIGVRNALGVMCRSGLVRLRPDSAIAGSTEAEWTHPLLREVAYDRLDEGVRRGAHMTVAHRLDDADTEPEAIAHHAAAAFELGARDEPDSEFVGAVAARAGRVALDRFALANAERWTALVRDTGHEPAPGTADTLEAELLLRRGDFEHSGALADRWASRADEVGTHALAVSAEAHLATGEYDAAERAAAAALARIPDSRWRDQITSAYVELLKRKGNYAEAATLAEQATQGARARGDRTMMARLDVQACVNGAYAANARGEDPIEQIRRVVEASDRLERAGDRRAFVEGACEIATLVSVIDPLRARQLLERAHSMAEDIGAVSRIADIEIHLAEAAFETDEAASAMRWIESAGSWPLDAATRLYQASFESAVRIAAGAESLSPDGPIFVNAEMADAQIATRHLAVTVPLWFGRLALVRQEYRESSNSAYVIAALAAAACEGPPWDADWDLATPDGPLEELALLRYLRGEYELGDDLVRERFEFLWASGSTYERYNWFFPGPLVMALGPRDVSPRKDWLLGQILRPEFPGLWCVHRAMCALLLAERENSRARELASAGLRLIEQSAPDEQVVRWLVPRLRLHAG